jgi:hypothetical protein
MLNITRILESPYHNSYYHPKGLWVPRCMERLLEMVLLALKYNSLWLLKVNRALQPVVWLNTVSLVSAFTSSRRTLKPMMDCCPSFLWNRRKWHCMIFLCLPLYTINNSLPTKKMQCLLTEMSKLTHQDDSHSKNGVKYLGKSNLYSGVHCSPRETAQWLDIIRGVWKQNLSPKTYFLLWPDN